MKGKRKRSWHSQKKDYWIIRRWTRVVKKSHNCLNLFLCNLFSGDKQNCQETSSALKAQPHLPCILGRENSEWNARHFPPYDIQWRVTLSSFNYTQRYFHCPPLPFCGFIILIVMLQYRHLSWETTIYNTQYHPLSQKMFNHLIPAEIPSYLHLSLVLVMRLVTFLHCRLKMKKYSGLSNDLYWEMLQYLILIEVSKYTLFCN